MPNRTSRLILILVILAAILGMSTMTVFAQTAYDTSVIEPDAGQQVTIYVLLETNGFFFPGFTPTFINGTATEGADYDGTGTLYECFHTEEPCLIPVIIYGDDTVEADETFEIDLSGIGFPVNNPTVTIIDNDSSQVFPEILITSNAGNANQFLQNEGANLGLDVVLSGEISANVTVQYNAASDAAIGTGAGGTDFTATSGTLTFTPGSATVPQTINVPILDDTIDEPYETFFMRFFSVTGAALLQTPSVFLYIQDTDAPPTLSVLAPASAAEGTADGYAQVVFVAQLSGASAYDITLNCTPNAGTATAGVDFLALTQTLTMPAGDTSMAVPVLINQDNIDEDNETLSVTCVVQNSAPGVTFTSPTTASSPAYTILDDDATPTLNVSSVTVSEGGVASIVLSLTNPSENAVTGTLTLAGGTATTGTDYTNAGPYAISILAGATSQTINVQTLADAVTESTETFNATLSGVSASATAGSNGVVTIVDSDITVASIQNALNADEGTNMTFTVTLSQAASSAVTVDYIANTGTALWNIDFTPTSGTLVINAGLLSGSFVVPTIQDTIDEPNEYLYGRISNLTGPAVIGTNSAVGFIVDDDAAPGLTVTAPASAPEGTGAASQAQFTLALTGTTSSSGLAFVCEISGGTATPGVDVYTSAQTVVIPPGATSSTFTVGVVGDALFEADETVDVTCTQVGGAATDSDTYTIDDDDAEPTLSINDVSVLESAGPAIVTVSLSAPSAVAVTADLDVTGGTATAGTDFVDGSTYAVSIPAGQTSVTVAIDIIDDNVDEPNETILLTLSNASVTTITDATSTVTILDDDDTPAVIITSAVTNSAQFTNVEGNPITVDLTVDNQSPTAIDIAYSTRVVTASTAAFQNDFTAASGTVTIPANSNGPVSISIVTNDDNVDEADTEAFELVLNITSGNAILQSPQVSLFIADNDARPGFALSSDPFTGSTPEGTNATNPNGLREVRYLIFLTGTRSQQDIPFTCRVDETVANSMTVADNDYLFSESSVVLASEENLAYFSVYVREDNITENDEVLRVVCNADNFQAVTNGSDDHVITFTNDDAAPTITVSDVSVQENAGLAVVNVSLSNPSASTITATVDLTDVTAVAPGDYTDNTYNLTFLPGQTSATFSVAIINDVIDEADETLTADLSGATNTANATDQGIITILDNDPLPSVTVYSATTTEGSDLVFNYLMSNPSGLDVTFDYTTSDATAFAGSDYTTTSGTITILAGNTSGSFNVPTTNDTTDEPNEMVAVLLSNSSNAFLTTGIAFGFIVDNDPTPGISINDQTRVEGDFGTSSMTFTVSLSNPSSGSIGVTCDTQGVTATSAEALFGDYISTNDTLVFVPGVTSLQFMVPIIGDLIDEPTETFNVNCSLASGNATIVDGTGVGTITDNDPTPTLNLGADVTVNENVGTVTVTATLSGVSQNVVGATLTLTNNTAVGGACPAGDFANTASPYALSIPAFSTTASATFAICDDALVELTEDFSAVLSAPTNATIADGTQVITILDNDLPTVSILDVSAAESAGTLDFTVTLSAVTSLPVSVDFSLTDGTATRPADYTTLNGTLIIPANTISGTISVAIVNDALDEADETFSILLSNLTNATPVGSTVNATGTITDDDATPTLNVADAAGVTEGAAAQFTVSLTSASGQDVTFNYATTGGTATSGADFVATVGSATIPAGSTSVVISVPTIDDALFENATETFTLDVSSVAGATAGDLSGAGSILNNDAAPTLTVDDVTGIEGTAVTLGARNLNLTLSAPSGVAATVNFVLTPGTATTPSDYANLSGTINIPAGVTNVTYVITDLVVQDSLFEADETFRVDLSNLSFATTAPTAGTITDAFAWITLINDDAAPTVQLTAATSTVAENAGSIIYTVQQSVASAVDTVVSFQTSNGTATAGADYTGNAGTVTIPAGSLSTTITVVILDDLLDESNETYLLSLNSATNAVLGAVTQNTTTITDNDATPTLNAPATATVDEGLLVNVTYTLTAASGLPVTFRVSTHQDTALAGFDYVGQTSFYTIPAGQTSLTVSIPTLEDVLDENNEIFDVRINGVAPTNAILGTFETVVTIIDDDAPPTLYVLDVVAVESVGLMQFEVVLNGLSGLPVNYTYSFTDGTATGGVDYDSMAGAGVIPAGQLHGVFTVPITDDALDEANETFTVTVTGPSNADSATGTILDNEGEPVLYITDVTVAEDTGIATMTASLTSATATDVVFDATFIDGTAIGGGVDYTSTTQPGITILAGTTSITFDVPITVETLFELDETFTVALTNVTGLSVTAIQLSDLQALVTITNDDQAPTVSLDPLAVSVAEGDSGSILFNLNVVLSEIAGVDITVAFDLFDGTATVADNDYADQSITVTIPAGSDTTAVVVEVLGDLVYENTEEFTAFISNPQPLGVTTDEDTTTITITNDDLRPRIWLEDHQSLEGNVLGTRTLIFNLTAPAGVDYTVDYQSFGGTATPGVDFNAFAGTATIPAGQTSVQVLIANMVLGDTLYEEDEAFRVGTSNPLLLTSPTSTVGLMATSGAFVELINDDAMPTISISPATLSIPEGDSANVTFTLSAAAGVPVTFVYATVEVDATSGVDYANLGGSITIPAGSTFVTESIVTIEDTIDEADEQFYVALVSATNAAINPAAAETLVTILDDDDAPTINIAPVTGPAAEGTVTNTYQTFVVTLSTASSSTVTVAYTTTDGAAGEAAVADNDYITAAGTLTFEPGELNKFVVVEIIADNKWEDDEDYTVDLSAAVGGTIGTASAAGQIVNDDQQPVVNFSPDFSVAESAGVATLVATLSNPTEETLGFTVSLTDGPAVNATGDADCATVGADYDNDSAAAFTVPAGTLSASTTVVICDDAIDEDPENFTAGLTFDTAYNASIADDETIVTIVDNDIEPGIEVLDVTVAEGGDLVFTVQLVDAVGAPTFSGRDVTFTYATSDGSALGGGVDYNDAAGSATILAGLTSTTLTVTTVDDLLFELDENMFVTLSYVNNIRPLDNDFTGEGTITDNDQAPTVSINDVTVAENAGPAIFTVTLSEAAGTTITVDFATASGTAIADLDFDGEIGTVTFLPGETTQSIVIGIVDDNLFEDTETYFVNLSNPVPAAVGITDAQGLGTITNDDERPRIWIEDLQSFEGSPPGAGTRTLIFSVSAPAGVDYSVDYVSVDNTATVADNDYTPISGTITVPAGDISARLMITNLHITDTKYEPDEVFRIALSNPVLGTILPTAGLLMRSGGIVELVNDDAAPVVSILPATQNVIEGASAAMTLQLSQISGYDTIVDIETQNGAALSGLDYDYISVAVTIPAGTLSVPLTSTTIDDLIDEADENYVVRIVGATNAQIGTDVAEVVIIDNDDTPLISISDVTLPEGTIDNTEFVFTVSLDRPSSSTVTVDYLTADDTALVADSDYVAGSGTVSFAPGQTSQTITVLVLADNKYELNETFFVDLSNPVNAAFGAAQGLGTITNDDAIPTFTIMEDVVVIEDNTLVCITGVLSNPSYEDIEFEVTTTAISPTLTDGTDYDSLTAAPMIFAAGDTIPSGQCVFIYEDTIYEPDEQFTADVTVVSGTVNVADGSVLVTIVDDDPMPIMLVAPATATEGTDLDFVVTLVNAAGTPIISEVPVTAVLRTADTDPDVFSGPFAATEGVDYTSQDAVVFTIPINTSTVNILVPTTDDAVYEETETLVLFLDLLTDADPVESDRFAIGTIVDNDPQPTLSINDVSLAEGNGPGTTAFVFTVTQSAATEANTTFLVSTADGPAPAATVADDDYNEIEFVTVVIPAGSTTASVTVNVNGDLKYEYDELFTVNLTIIANADAAGSDLIGQGTIVNDDIAPTIYILDTEVAEGDAGTVLLQFPVRLSAVSGVPVTFTYDSADITALVADNDYVAAVAAGPVTINPGQWQAYATITVNSDVTYEANETLQVTITPDAQAIPGDLIAVGTIITDDTAAAISIADVTVVETNAGTVDVTFTITMTTPSAFPYTITYQTVDGDGIGGPDATVVDNDYNAMFGTWTYPANSTTADFTLVGLVNGDTKYELDDQFRVIISLVSGGEGLVDIADGESLVTITNDDTPPVITIDQTPVSVVEPDAGTVDMIFTAVMSNASYQDISVTWDTSNGTATVLDSDYVEVIDGTIQFLENEVSKTFLVLVNGDNKYEPDETLNVTLDTVTIGIASIGVPGTHVGTIVDNDPIPTVNILGLTVGEAVGTFNIEATLSNPSYQTIEVSLVTTQNTAFDPADYVGTAGATLTFLENQVVSSPFVVTVVDDTLYEVTEDFSGTITLVGGTGDAVIGTGVATYYITDNDVIPGLVITDVAILEGDAGITNLVFTVTQSAISGADTTFTINTVDGSGLDANGDDLGAQTAKNDYVAIVNGAGLIAAGGTGTTVTVSVNGDLKFENDETFLVILSNVVNAAETVAGDFDAVGTILNDDPLIPLIEAGLLNGGFESGLAPWRKQSPNNTNSTDKVVCNGRGADGSNCYFKFDGVQDESSRIIQVIRAADFGTTLNLQDGFLFSLYYSTGNAVPRLSIKARVYFTDLTPTKTFGTGIVVAATGRVWLYAEDSVVLDTSVAVDRVKVVIRNQTEFGRVRVDEVRLAIVPGAGFPRDAVRTGTDSAGVAPLPLPGTDGSGWSATN